MMQDLPLPGCRYCYKRPVEEGYSFCLACLRTARLVIYLREKQGEVVSALWYED